MRLGVLSSKEFPQKLFFCPHSLLGFQRTSQITFSVRVREIRGSVCQLNLLSLGLHRGPLSTTNTLVLLVRESSAALSASQAKPSQGQALGWVRSQRDCSSRVKQLSRQRLTGAVIQGIIHCHLSAFAVRLSVILTIPWFPCDNRDCCQIFVLFDRDYFQIAALLQLYAQTSLCKL